MKPSLQLIQLTEHVDNLHTTIEGLSGTCYFKGQEVDLRNRPQLPCYTINEYGISSNYYIGVDWLSTKRKCAIHISPKLNTEDHETAYLKMLLACLNDPKASRYLSSIYEIKLNSEAIEINQSQDVLSPILAIQFLHLVKQLVKKGLRKAYYNETHSLHSRIKGKLLISQTIKQHTVKNEPLKAQCSYDVFGLNHPENQLLKAALLFVQSYLNKFKQYSDLVAPIVSYCLPAFQQVKVPKDLRNLRSFKSSPFFSNYKEALTIARIILDQFGNVVRTTETGKIKTLPYWVNMALLFELYVYTLLRKKFGNQVLYQYKANYQELDFLLRTEDVKLVIDTKYKPRYTTSPINKEDVRQLSGYSRIKKVRTHLKVTENELVKCLIIYSNKHNNNTIEPELNFENMEEEPRYEGIFKLGVSLPWINP
ncbi:5-methylcytosine restriction system specificity protein McrC [Maribacter aurantiacus]|uniref:Restriction endonuclease n=1 Tax=Maribacter aurantiacus TaxID=1882343 RepID=A0A5R8M7S0_9FLAO|nr:hypothetical protein [Maribacter aurantiacus]TLF44819.1 hypothetical protein FEK29_08615 [Maribacter aurantiacus]